VLFSTYSTARHRQDPDMDSVDEGCGPLNVSGRVARPAVNRPARGQVTLSIDGVVWQELCHEAERQDVDAQELAAFALLYYLADADSGRIARSIPLAMERRRAPRRGARERETR
jgi:hypothetical protein